MTTPGGPAVAEEQHRSEQPAAGARRRGPGVQRGGRPRPMRCAGCTRHLRRRSSRSRSASPSPTTPAPTARSRSPRRLAAELPGVEVLRPGARRAAAARCARRGWRSDAPVLAYMDVDLSTDLAALLPLVAPLISGHSDLAIGTRLSPRRRGWSAAPKREVISRCYNLMLRGDAGRPVLRRAVRLQGDPRRRRRSGCCRWSRTPAGSSTPSCWCSPSAAGLRIHEVPVDWVDDPDSRVDIVATATRRPRRHRPAAARAGHRTAAARRAARAARPRPLRPPRAGRAAPGAGRARWSGSPPIGVASHRWPTCCCSCCCAARSGAQAANLVALLLTAIANTAANRRFTFGVRGRRRRGPRTSSQGLVVFGLGLALTSGVAGACCTRSPPTPPAAVELGGAASPPTLLATAAALRAASAAGCSPDDVAPRRASAARSSSPRSPATPR